MIKSYRRNEHLSWHRASILISYLEHFFFGITSRRYQILTSLPFCTEILYSICYNELFCTIIGNFRTSIVFNKTYIILNCYHWFEIWTHVMTAVTKFANCLWLNIVGVFSIAYTCLWSPVNIRTLNKTSKYSQSLLYFLYKISTFICLVVGVTDFHLTFK